MLDGFNYIFYMDTKLREINLLLVLRDLMSGDIGCIYNKSS